MLGILRRRRVDVQLPEAATERLVLFERDGLVAKEEDEMFQQCRMNLLKGALIERVEGKTAL
jgi:hypothetical protein